MPAGTATSGRANLRRRVLRTVLILLTAGLGALVPAPQGALAASPGVASISAGFFHSCALESGKAYCWGNNTYGQLGNGTTTDSSVPVAVDTSGVLAGKTLTQITAGRVGSATCALDAAGAAYCWGYNFAGQLGDGNTTDSPIPVQVSGM